MLRILLIVLFLLPASIGNCGPCDSWGRITWLRNYTRARKCETPGIRVRSVRRGSVSVDVSAGYGGGPLMITNPFVK